MIRNNELRLIGNVGSNPIEDKNGYVKFSMATNDGSTEYPKTNWHYVSCKGTNADYVKQNVKKGAHILIIGRQDNTEKENVRYSNVFMYSMMFLKAKE